MGRNEKKLPQLDGKIGSGYEKSEPPSVSHISGMGTPLNLYISGMGIENPEEMGRKIFEVWLVIYQVKGN